MNPEKVQKEVHIKSIGPTCHNLQPLGRVMEFIKTFPTNKTTFTHSNSILMAGVNHRGPWQASNSLYSLTVPSKPSATSISSPSNRNSLGFTSMHGHFYDGCRSRLHVSFYPRDKPASKDFVPWASYRYSIGEEEEAASGVGFKEAVAMFNDGDYYECHDVLDRLWYSAQDPKRTLLHGVLQCAVGFHHLFNRNHKGAMMELGEGLCKLRKMNFESGPFSKFEGEISAVLDFIYQTQLELAACSEDLCLTLDQSERSYQLLGGYAAGEKLYSLQANSDGAMHIIFSPERYKTGEHLTVKLPILLASEEHLEDVESDRWP